jgi:ABC-type uncharacterized transport system fused permease/ATPase subunit
LEYLIERHGGADELAAWPRRDWTLVLSGGERQRLGAARLLFHRPHVAILDEATNALDEPTEAALMGALTAAGIAMLSVAHRSTLRRWHQVEVAIARDGSATTTQL